ncbi:MAG: methionyl-tRNA formyltransferase, partial [Sphingobium sp.]
ILPRWRGAAPVQRAILAGDAETGVTIMQMETGLDTGPMRAIWRTSVAGKTAGGLTDELAQAGAREMVRVLADLAAFPPEAQPEDGVTYAAKIEKVESRIDFTQGAEQVERQVRAFNPMPGAWLSIDGERIKILAAETLAQDGPAGALLDGTFLIGCNTGSIRPMLVQRAGKGAMPVADMLRGFTVAPGTTVDAG